MSGSSRKPEQITFIGELYNFLTLFVDGLTIIQLNAVYNDIISQNKKINDSTHIFVSKEIFISEYLFYLEKNEPYLLKKSGFKAWWFRLIGGLFDSVKLYQKGLNNLPLASLSQIKLERKLYNFSDQKKLQLFTYYSEKLNILIIYHEVKFFYRGAMIT